MAITPITQPVPTPAIVIYRKAVDVPNVSRLKASAAREQRAAIAARSRVNRDAVLDHFQPSPQGRSAFHRQDALLSTIIDNPQQRQWFAACGWVVPDDCLGRAPKSGERDFASTAQSLLLWIKQTVVAAGWCDASEISVVVEHREHYR
jgi:hypothetical protein